LPGEIGVLTPNASPGKGFGEGRGDVFQRQRFLPPQGKEMQPVSQIPIGEKLNMDMRVQHSEVFSARFYSPNQITLRHTQPNQGGGKPVGRKTGAGVNPQNRFH
jgi:hypothetical protein